MAEARREEEDVGERRDLRDVRNRSPATDHPERTKPDHLHSSQGPLSSIRAAIKRSRSTSHSDHTRERRRPEITIVAAEPLDSNTWLSGTSVVFPRPPQSGWSAGIQAVSKPPPSYDQVIHEKTQEQHAVKPTAAPRRSTCTTTSGTQTDPVREVTPRSAAKRPSGKKPQKPPRPSLPKPADRGPVPEPAAPADERVGTNTAVSTNTDDHSDSGSDVKPPDSPYTCSRSVTVSWVIPLSPDSEPTRPPVPLPRTKSRKQRIAEEVKVQTLVKLSEHCDDVPADPDLVSSNKYYKELLEVFGADNKSEENADTSDQSDEAFQGEDAGCEMNTNHSQRNIRARIQAFEIQTSIEGENVVEPVKPEPQPRKAINKPPVAAKPSVAPKPQSNHSVDNDYQNVFTTNSPTPAPRPQPTKKPVDLPVKEELETLFSKGAVPNRSRLSVLTRANSIYEEDPPLSPLGPTPPAKPFKEPLKPNLNINNHNSAFMVTENVYVDSPSISIPAIKPQHSVDSNEASFPRQSLTRRPTTIRVPSKTGSLSDNFVESPPPLPAQKPVGSLHTSVTQRQSQMPILPRQESFPFGPEPSLPPRRLMSSKTLPARPPPAKAGPGRPPPPSLQATSRSHSASWEASPKPQAKKPLRKGPVLPPRPHPGHRLYNKYIFELPHGIASCDYNGSNTGELSFQQNEVLLLLEEIDHNTFECQVGDAKGRVHKSRMKVITPLSSVSHMSPPQDASPAGSELKVQATHDFNPEGPGELALKAGDVVTMVERLDDEWYKGTCRGSAGFFPVNHVKVLSSSPKPLPERKAKPQPSTVSGPRCVARYDFEGENGDELSFSEGDVIQLKAFIGQEWAQGQIGASSGVFPLNFVEVIEDLPQASSQQKRQSIGIALPGMVASPNTQPEAAKPAQASQPGGQWVVALYDFAGDSDGELSFQRGDCIQISQHVDAEWSCGQLNGREGMFPRAFVESRTGEVSPDNQQRAAAPLRGRALFDYSSECDEELSLQVGDVVTGLESVDDEWFLGDLRGKRALVPKNYIQVLG